MTKSCRKKVLTTLATVVVCLAALTIGGAWYLIDYALKPGDRSRNEQLAWHEVDSLYPGMIQWRDSLTALHALHDTVLLAPDGTRLHAVYARAARPTANTALLVHGYTDNAVRMLPLGRMYLDSLHMNILVPDLRNAGQSGGDHFQMGWYDRLDVRRWVDAAPKLFSDSVRIVVHGVSMGAATTMMLSGDADVPHSVRAYVEDCGYTSVHDQFTKELAERFSLPEFPIIPVASTLCKMRYGWDFNEASALRQVAQCRRPMLFIHGTADKFVPTAMVYPLYRAKPAPKALWLAPGAPHARSYHLYPAEYTKRVRQFLQTYGF